MKKCLIVCNGSLTKKLLNRFTNNKLRSHYNIISCDGASDFLYRHKVFPDVIIGDMDGIEPKTLKYFKSKKVRIKTVEDQNQNDLEKALGFAISKKFNKVNIIGFVGKRFDHTINNLSILKKFYMKADIIVYDLNFEIRFIKKNIKLDCRIGDVVSIIPLFKASGIKTSGLKHPLKNESLEFGVREGALNEAVDKTVSVSFKNGHLLLLRQVHC